MRRYLVFIGTRPEAIKMCPLILALKRRPEVRLRVVLTGQHRDMVRSVLDFFGVRADADLGVMREGQRVQELSERLLVAISEELRTSGFVPDAVLVHGDTTTAFVGALCAFYAGIPVVHVEAGLRTDDIYAPFPEEFNRRAVDAMSEVHFAPTGQAAERLRAEGYAPCGIMTVGNTATDALRLCLAAPATHPLLEAAAGRRLLVITAHRREMPPEKRYALLRAIRKEIEKRADVLAVCPVHPSPAVQRAMQGAFAGCGNVRLCEPLDLPVLQQLLSRAYLLLTDSGGMQEEATYLGVPTLVLRDTTERPEGVQAGVLRLAGTQSESVRAELARLLDDEVARESMAISSDVYGDGYVSERIVRALEGYALDGGR